MTVAYNAIGSSVAGTSAITVVWPTHAAGDVALLIVQSANEAISLSSANGFVEVANSPQGTGTAATADSARLAVFWCRATSSSMASPVVADSGNRTAGVIITFTGCVDSGDPVNVTGGDVLASDSSTVTVPGASTTVDGCMIVAICAHAIPTSSIFSGWTNSNLSSVTERLDFGSNDGVGGGFALATGSQALAGDYGATTASMGANSCVQGRISVSLAAVSAPVMSFFDKYDGVDDLSTHAPDIGGAYTLSAYGAGGALTDLTLDGSGGLVIPFRTAPAGEIIPVAKSVVTPPSALGWKYSASMNLSTAVYTLAEGSGSGVTVPITVEDTATNAGLFLQINGNSSLDTDLPSTDPGQAYYQVITSGAVLAYTSATFDFDPTIHTKFELIVNVAAGNTTFKINGTVIDVAGFVPDVAPDAVHSGGGSLSDASACTITESSLDDLPVVTDDITETILLEDQIEPKEAVIEAVDLSDAITNTPPPQNVVETMGVADAQVTVVTFNLVETLDLSGALVSERRINVPETLGLSDVVALTATTSDDVVEDVGLQAVMTTGVQQDLSETVDLSDAQAQGVAANNVESLALADVATVGSASVNAVAAALALGDDVSLPVVTPQDVEETLGLADDQAFTVNADLPEGVALSTADDAASVSVNNVAESLAVRDLSVTQVAQDIEETLDLSDESSVAVDVAEGLVLSAVATSISSATNNVVDSIVLRDSFTSNAPQDIAETLDLADEAVFSVVALMQEGVGLGDTIESLVSATIDTIERLGLSDTFLGGVNVDVAETAGLSDIALAAGQLFVANVAETLDISDVADPRSNASQLLDESIALSDALSSLMDAITDIVDDFMLSDVVAGGGEGGAWTAPTDTMAMSRYDNFQFQSMGMVDGVLLGASDDGEVFRLDGDDDNGMPISARLVDDWRDELDGAQPDPRKKRLRALWTNGYTAGVMSCQIGYVDLNGNEAITAPITFTVRGDGFLNNRAILPRGACSRYLQPIIANVNGCDFSLNNGALQVDPSHRRIG